ncbi:gamma-glutamyl-gamma-aminobutyrate hydrolase family protein [Tsukamurella tyrosinosolvens]|uniref:gamma-glutamyl-gamma-aminobutyrate hydrolase family protein n=1 Tax=Tsukamurella tyrosinosolvens TaxID=57704 RepID=UPI001AF65C0B|nr:gamma-glutamyl-gamma-aminobutyrate hydrolase family protein [Tsukamurella tyrosinosolvens]QRY84149.1 gamma-glutamyl-gamma-aminobutyrate hydrolase family protein [Tsukamurella tyrosinosolvens]
MSRKPLVGITGRRFQLSLLASADPRYGKACMDSFMSAFATRIAEAGGVPVHLPYDADPADACEWLSGVVVTGGQDVHPDRWGGDASVVRGIDPRTDTNAHDPERDEYEFALTRAAIDRGIPLLGVCRGVQVLNVALGGTLIADLPPGPIPHLSQQGAPTDGDADHVVTFVPGSTAARVFGPSMVTNSWHHQALDRCGAGLVVTGRAPDGVIEAVEVPGAPILGVQWHPEWMERDDPAMDWIVDESRKRQEAWG